jgi:23S rRNA (uracil1939-C5)-methyltransferase
LDPARQIVYKQDWLLENLLRIGKVQPEQVLEPLTGPYWGYRHKARLGVRYVPKKGRVLVGFRERSSSFVADLRRCEILHPRVGFLLEDLGELVHGLSIFRRLPQIEVAAGDAGLALSFRVLDSPSAEDRARLVEFGRRHDVQIYLQPKGPETTHLLWPETAELSYRLPAYDLELKFKPFHFTQVNAEINRRMIDRAIALLDVKGDDRVLDLFCGLGNFTLPLARRAASVVGVEGDIPLLQWAGQNARDNGVDNVRFFVADLSAEVDAQPWMGERYDKVLLDPPRSGALEMMAQIARLNPRRVVYVSCHPATLARDAGELVHRFGYGLLSAGVMDMFPHTAHVESIALFGRR